jgi:hypothetical protein
MSLSTDNLIARLLVVTMLVSPVIAWAASETIFISEVYFNTYTDGLVFIELYNKSQSSQDIDGWVIEVLDEGMDTITLPDDAVIPGYGFYLIGRSADQDSWSGETYPPDYYTEANLSFFDDRGAVELLDGTCQSLDKLGWGDCSQNYYEHQPCAIPEEGHSLERKSGPTHNEMGGNSYDTDDNLDNFRDRTYPEPQNITSITEKPLMNVGSESWSYIKAMYK